MEESSESKFRCVYFSSQETDILLKLASKFRDIIDDKKTDGTVWKRKEETWNTMALIFNKCTSEMPRTARQLKTRYEKIKRDIRRRYRKAQNISDIKLHNQGSSAHLELEEIIYNELQNKNDLDNVDKISTLSESEHIIMEIEEDEENDVASQTSLQENIETLSEDDSLATNDMLDTYLKDVKIPGPNQIKTLHKRKRMSLFARGHRIASKKEKLFNILISTARQKKEHNIREHKTRMGILTEQENQEKLKTEILKLELVTQTKKIDNSAN